MKYHPPTDWLRVSGWVAKAVDGSQAWLDMRGAVGIDRADGVHISFGADLALSGDGPHEANFEPPPAGSRLRVYTERSLEWEREGRRNKDIITASERDALLQSLLRGQTTMGYLVEFVDVTS